MKRRDFLKTSGALVVSFGAASLVERVGLAQGQFGTRASHIDPSQLDSWIAIAADGRVTVYTGKCELGQGILTAQAQLAAEELSVPLDRVNVIMCDTDVCPDQGTTSGSQSTPTNFNERNLALAAATARQALLKLASTRLGVPVDQLTAADGAISASSDRSKRVTYGDLVAGRKLNVQLDPDAKRKTESAWAVLGKPALNFAFADGVERYHTAHDDVAHLNPGSVQHHGSQMLMLARAFGDGPLPRPV